MSTKFSHVKGSEVEFKGGGLRDFFLYKDLGDGPCEIPPPTPWE